MIQVALRGSLFSACIRVHRRFQSLLVATGTLAALSLAGCGSAPKQQAPAPAPGPAKPPASTFGKYYSDDGPPERLPDNLHLVPDATPRDEPWHRFANRPYTVFGQTYVPVLNRERTKERGIASWYGRKFHGQRTASGEPYDMFAMTAAHKTFPIPSFAKVTNVKTGQSVVVRVNDRGPFHADRVIDLSYAAAARIGIAGPGSGMVEVERVYAPEDAPANAVAAVITGTPPPAVALAPPSVATPLLTVPAPVPAAVETSMVTQEAGSLWLQVGAFSSLEAAESFRDHTARQLDWMREPIAIQSRDGLHRVRLGPYRSREEAAAIAEKVRQSLGVAPVTTR